MLQKITIKNFVLIEEINVDFSSGLNVITGETGAGKSLILKAINLLIGKKISGNFVRNGTKQASIIGVFSIPENFKAPNDLEIEDEIIIRKVIKANNSSKFYLNDIAVTRNLIQEITFSLLEIHGQSEQRFLGQSDKQLEYIDSMLEEQTLIQQVKEEFQPIKNIKNELDEINNIKKSASFEANYLKQIADDLKNLAPIENEYENIENNFHLAKEQEKHKNQINEISNLFTAEHAICDLLAKAQNKINSLANNMINIEQVNENIIALAEQADALVTNLKDIKDNYSNIDNLDNAERISEYKRLARKYQKRPEELAEFYSEINQKLTYLNNLAEREVELENLLQEQQNKFLNLAQKLSKKRQEKILLIEQEISKDFADLNMAAAKLTIKQEILTENSYNLHGIDKISFFFAGNPGQKAQEISKVASGGELSRIMLALKVVQKDYKNTACLIFDEIDSGIGGNTAAKLAEKLANLAKHTQIILITHQALIAELADSNFLLKKEIFAEKTITNLRKLDQKEKEQEMQRLFFGKIS